MKFKICLITLFILGLSAASAFAVANPTLVVGLNKNIANFVAADDSVVIGSFVVSNSSGQQLGLDAFKINGASNSIEATEMSDVRLYEDINMNGEYDPGVDTIVMTKLDTDDIADFEGGDFIILPVPVISFPDGAKRYYIVVATIISDELTVGGLEGSAIKATLDVSDDDAADDDGLTKTADVNYSTGGAATPTNQATVAIVATKLEWNPAMVNALVGINAAEDLITTDDAAIAVLSAVDDFGNLDTGITGTTSEVVMSAKLLNAPGTDAAGTLAGASASDNYTSSLEWTIKLILE